jgi:hypothetical protein
MFPDIVKSDRLPSNAFKFYDETLKQSIRPKKIRDRFVSTLPSSIAALFNCMMVQ